MKKYYSCYPICPNCLNPASNDIYLIEDNEKNVFICNSCNSKFRNVINYDQENDLITQFPLFSEIKLNIIEFSYIGWILSDDFEGKFFITWPWDNVRFFPILLSEYFQKFGVNKVVVFIDFDCLNSSLISDLDYSLSLDSLFYFDENYLLKPKNYSFNNKDIFFKKNYGYCRISVNSMDVENIYEFNKIVVSNFSIKNMSPISFKLEDYNGFEFPCGVIDNEKTCFRNFLDKFKSFFGENSIKSIDYGNKIDHIKGNGIFELKFFERNEFDKKLKINDLIQNSTHDVFYNKFNLLSPLYNINYDFIYSMNDLNKFFESDSRNLLFINEDILSKQIVEFVKTFNPNLVLSNIDGLFGYDRFKSGHPIWKLFNLDCDMLFFSTDLNRRSTYNPLDSGRFIKEKGLVYHSWDHPEILMKLFEKDKKDSSLFSSSFYNIHGENDALKIKFKVCEELEDIDECFTIFKETLNNDGVNKFIKTLIKTPIYIEGHYKSRHRNLSWQYLLSIVFNLDIEKWKFLNDSFKKVYGWKSAPKNPLFDTILELITDNNWDGNEFAIIVSPHDRKRFKRLLDETVGENNILVTSWKDLNKNIENSSVKYAISTEFPILDYNLFDSPLKEAIIIASPMTINTFNKYHTNRLTQKHIKPLYLLKENEKAPNLLKELLNEFKVEDIEEFNIEINKDVENTSKDNVVSYRNFNKAKKGDEVILVSNSEGKNMILPFDRSISILAERIDTIKISREKNNWSNLLNTNIIINNPLNITFFKFLLDNDDDFEIKYDKYQWKTFADLISSMFEWIDLLHSIVQKEGYLSQKSLDDVKKDIVSKIKKEAGVNVKTDYYIKKSWLSEPIDKLKISDDETILIYDAERISDSKNVFKIYQWALKEYNELSIPPIEAYKSHAAAIKFQNLRREFFHNDIERIPDNLKKLNDEFQLFIKDEFDESDLFKVISIKIGYIKQDVKLFTVLEGYSDYFVEKNLKYN